MVQKILVMGLPGSGKTTFSNSLKEFLESQSFYRPAENLSSSRPIVEWFNADDVRKKFDDWDFSEAGRIRQSKRMHDLAAKSKADFVICDFVAPIVEMRNNFKADWIIWMDTIEKGRFEDTNKMFQPPEFYDFRITEQNAEKWSEFVGSHIIDNRRRPIFEWRRETVQMLGRWQPWHSGHRALFERALAKTGQVCIMIRDCQGWNQTNPFSWAEVKQNIKRDLDPLYQGQYEIVVVPNIVEIVYGRDVGYSINRIDLPEDIQQISATKIREEMKNKGLL
jgi:adenylylsulfate kinase